MNLEDGLKEVLGLQVHQRPTPGARLAASTVLPSRTRPRRPLAIGGALGSAMLVMGVVAALYISIPAAPLPTSQVPVAGVTSSPNAPTEPPTPVVDPTAAATETPSLEPPAPTIAELSEIQRSDLFWDNLTGGEWGSDHDSLNEIATDSDLIVVGRVTAVHFGERVGAWEVTRATIEIDEIIKGEPQTLTPGTITLQGVPAFDRESTEANIPSHGNLMFLWYAPWLLDRLGQPADEQNAEMYDYVLVNSTQGLVRDIDGAARVLDPRDHEQFPATLEGDDFARVLQEIRDLVE